jgi:large subunit ribosomal protein L15
MSLLNKLTSLVDRKQKRVGRGYGSGKGGHTAGRGTKGQLSRSGGKRPIWFEGGQLPMIKRMPMLRGKGRFNVIRSSTTITLADLEKMKAKTISLETLKKEKVIDQKFKKAKIIKKGKLSREVKIKNLPVSKGAKLAIEEAGGSVAS